MATSIPVKATEPNGPRAYSHVDAHVGRQIRVWRILARKSRAELAAAVGVSRQQIQNYEIGRNLRDCRRLERNGWPTVRWASSDKRSRIAFS
jgi:hypothetical protein